MMNTLVRYWWMMALQGLCAVIFGVLALILPGITLGTLVFLFGAYSLASGALSVATAVQHRDRFWALLVGGLLGIGAGLVAFFWPGVTALALLYLIAGWAVATGVFELIAAIKLRKVMTGEILLGLSGLCSIVFGLLLMIWPGAGALAVVWLIGGYAVVLGAMRIGLAFRLHAVQKSGSASIGSPRSAEV